ncbi:MAG: hypothetical protein ACI4NG_02015, partial [Candidatus Gallimonas sp.]
MIHSLSGGVIAENGCHTFAKVRFLNDPVYGDRPYWYLCPFPSAEAGSRVLAPVGRREEMREGVIERIERGVSEQCAPVPMNRVREIAALV